MSLLRSELLDLSDLSGAATLGQLASYVVVINLIHDQLIRQSVRISINALQTLGMGAPPVPYAFLLFGSGGRQEQALVSDQDNGLVYQLPDYFSERERDEVKAYFHLLAASIVKGLEEIGYPPCQGNVTCVHSRWNGDIVAWKQLYDDWCAAPTWENARYLLIVGDARVLAGDISLFHELQSHFYRHIAVNPLLFSRLVSNTLYHRVPLGWFGRILPEVQGRYRGAINLKNGVYLPFVNCVRHFALAHGIRACSTLERLVELREQRIWSDELCSDVEVTFRQILGLRLVAPLHWNDDHYLNNSFLRLTDLSKDAVVTVKRAMKLALQLQAMTAKLPDRL